MTRRTIALSNVAQAPQPWCLADAILKRAWADSVTVAKHAMPKAPLGHNIVLEVAGLKAKGVIEAAEDLGHAWRLTPRYLGPA